MDNKEKPKTIPVQNLPDIYANVAKVSFTQHEFEVTLGLASSNYEGVRPVANVRLSPTFYRELIRVLQQNLEGYEKNFGAVDSTKVQ
jgi:hypothetical protein